MSPGSVRDVEGARVRVTVVGEPLDTAALSAALLEAGYEPHVQSAAPEPFDAGARAIVIDAFGKDPAEAIARSQGSPVVLSCARRLPKPRPSDVFYIEGGSGPLIQRLRADAYVSRPEDLAEALDYVLTDERDLRSAGPLRLTFVGCTGLRHEMPFPIGVVFLIPVNKATTLGRSSTADISIASGTVARLHARVQNTGSRVLVEDLQSTNGTWSGGVRSQVHELAPGDELSIAGFFRMRLDGGALTPYR
jgi:hypothetical protein